MNRFKGTILATFAFLALAAGNAEAAFSNSLLVRASTGQDSTSPRIYVYESTGETLAVITAADYFASGTANPQRLAAGDLIFVKGSDGSKFVTVTSASTTASVVVPLATDVWVCGGGASYGTAGAVGYITAPIAGTIKKFYHVLTTVVDGDVVLNLDIGGSNATGSATITAAGVAVGDIDSATVSAGGTVTAGALIKVESDGGGTAGAGTTCVNITP